MCWLILCLRWRPGQQSHHPRQKCTRLPRCRSWSRVSLKSLLLLLYCRICWIFWIFWKCVGAVTKTKVEETNLYGVTLDINLFIDKPQHNHNTNVVFFQKYCVRFDADVSISWLTYPRLSALVTCVAVRLRSCTHINNIDITLQSYTRNFWWRCRFLHAQACNLVPTQEWSIASRKVFEQLRAEVIGIAVVYTRFDVPILYIYIL